MTMGYFTILESNIEGSGKCRVRVDFFDESIFLKFPGEPTQEQVDWEVIDFLTRRENAPTDES